MSARATVALYGGTFDPPHLGHEAVLAAACAAYGRVLVTPAWQPPHKALSAVTPSHGHRLAMARLLAEPFGNAEVSELEISRGKPCYTVDTLARLRELYPDAPLALVVGGDMFLSLPKWFQFGRIAQMAEIAVACRTDEPGERQAVLRAAGAYGREYGARVKILAHQAVDVSSTDIRAALSQPPPSGGDAAAVAVAVHGLPPCVRDYIAEKGLYRSGSNA